MQFDKVIAKIKGCNYFAHSVVCAFILKPSLNIKTLSARK